MPPITLTVDMAQRQIIQIGATGLAGLAQEIRMVLATRKGSVPLDRDFGLSWDHVDRPMGEAMQYMVAEIGQQLEEEFGVKHLPSDFKKHNGYLRSLQLSEEYGLYRQDYCGCEFSAQARGL